MKAKHPKVGDKINNNTFAVTKVKHGRKNNKGTKTCTISPIQNNNPCT